MSHIAANKTLQVSQATALIFFKSLKRKKKNHDLTVVKGVLLGRSGSMVERCVLAKRARRPPFLGQKTSAAVAARASLDASSSAGPDAGTNGPPPCSDCLARQKRLAMPDSTSGTTQPDQALSARSLRERNTNPHFPVAPFLNHQVGSVSRRTDVQL